MKKLTIGILAHVDAGKTTLSESILFQSGAINKIGRVDNKDSFLDNSTEERKHGITIFSKCARCIYKNNEITIIDTPGHVDFSGEMERTLEILDYAILVISGTDGVQSHTSTLKMLLDKYKIPLFVFVTKMDVTKIEKEQLLSNLKSRLYENIVDFTDNVDHESIALCDETALEKYLAEGKLKTEEITKLIKQRKLVPCIFGSGLKQTNVDKLLDIIDKYTVSPEYNNQFSATVYKIARDNQECRLTFAKITGGDIAVKNLINGEKINQIRLYSGQKYTTSDKVYAGDVCAFTGLESTYCGEHIGKSNFDKIEKLSPVLSYKVILPKNIDAFSVLPYFKTLQDEDPLLNVIWNEVNQEIQIQLMGKVQIEILKNIILERFNIDVSFDSGSIIYKETISDIVEGVGHYEPLKHYAEVHLILEPLPLNSGLQFESNVSTDKLELNWQNLILTHLQEKQHKGVLTGSPVTDIRISLISGKAHLKHTEGGDFRQATYRAVRQGLMKASSILLEPYYSFSLSIPSDCIGRALNDIHLKSGTHDAPIQNGDMTVINGQAPASEMCEYSSEVLSYTRGNGRLSLTFAGYKPCHNAQEIINLINYNPENDTANSADSIFCSHGAGININWKDVDNLCHIPLLKDKSSENIPDLNDRFFRQSSIDERELEAIMEREFGPIKRKTYTSKPQSNDENRQNRIIEYTRIIVDGYNVIHSWDNLNKLASDSLDSAREVLINALVNYSSYTGIELIIVFDAYKSSSTSFKDTKNERVHIVYTDYGVSADNYIESMISEIGKNENVKVVSSDAMIQLSAIRVGVLRISSREFKYDVDNVIVEISKKIKEGN